MWADLYYEYLMEALEFSDVIEIVQNLGFEVIFHHLNDGNGWLFLMIEEDLGYQDGRGHSLRNALLDGLFVLYEHEAELFVKYEELLS